MDQIGEQTQERYDIINRDEKTQLIFQDYYFLSNDYEDLSLNYLNNKFSSNTKNPSIKLVKDFPEKESVKELKVQISTSIKNIKKLNLPNINKFKPGEGGDLNPTSNSNNKCELKSRLKRNLSSVSTNISSYSSSLKQQNPHLLKMKSISNLNSVLMRNQITNGSLSKLSYSTKNLK